MRAGWHGCPHAGMHASCPVQGTHEESADGFTGMRLHASHDFDHAACCMQMQPPCVPPPRAPLWSSRGPAGAWWHAPAPSWTSSWARRWPRRAPGAQLQAMLSVAGTDAVPLDATPKRMPIHPTLIALPRPPSAGAWSTTASSASRWPAPSCRPPLSSGGTQFWLSRELQQQVAAVVLAGPHCGGLAGDCCKCRCADVPPGALHQAHGMVLSPLQVRSGCCAGLEPSVFMHPQHLHLTIAMLKLYRRAAWKWLRLFCACDTLPPRPAGQLGVPSMGRNFGTSPAAPFPGTNPTCCTLHPAQRGAAGAGQADAGGPAPGGAAAAGRRAAAGAAARAGVHERRSLTGRID